MPGTREEMKIYVIYLSEPNKYPVSFNEKILDLTTVGQYLQSETHHLVNRYRLGHQNCLYHIYTMVRMHLESRSIIVMR